MAYQAIGVGTTPGDGTGDTIRGGGAKINENFVELYTLLGTGTALTSGISATATVVTLAGPTITGVASFADGSVSAPSITNTGDTNTGIFFSAADKVNVTTGGTERIEIDSAGLAVVGVITATSTITGTTLEATGDTAAGDNAALGYTAAEGLILTGQGSTNDVTIKNDADADVIEIPTGTTNVTVAGTFGTGGLITSGAGIVIANAGNIGSAGDTDAISIGSDGDVTLTQDLELQHDGVILSFGANDEVTLTHVHNDGLLLNDDMQLQFRDSAINIRSDADGDLDINADDEIELNSTLIDINGAVDISGATTVGGRVIIDDATEATSTTDGSLQTDGGLSVVKDAVFGDDVKLLSDASVMSFGANSEITMTHVHDTGLTLTHTATGDNTPMVLQLKSEEDAIIANEVIGSLEFAAGDSDGTDGATVAAGIHAIAEDTFSASANATKLVFTTGVSETAASSATAKATLSSIGDFTVAGDLVIKDGGTIGSASDLDAIAIASDGVVTMNQIPVFSAGINVSGGTIAGTLASAAQANITSLGTLTTLTVDNIIINGTNIGHTSDTDSIAIASDGTVTFSQIPVFPGGAVQVGDIASNAVTSVKIATNAVTTAKITDLNVTTAKLANDAVTSDKIADDAVDSEHYAAGSIDLEHMSANSVDSDQYVDGSIDLAHMSANSVDSDQYVDGSIDAEHIATGAVTTAKLAAGAVTSAKIADDAVTSAKIAADAVTLTKMAANSIDSDQYVDGSIDTAHIADNQITLAKMAGLARGKIIYGDTNGDPDALALGSSGTVLTSDGTDISWAATSGLAADSVDSAQLVDGSIDTVHISNDAVTNAKIGSDAVTGTEIADNAIDSEHYTDGSIDLAHMSANSVDSDQYVDGSIDLEHMSANSVDSDQYVDGSIDLAHMSANSVDSAQYVDGSIDTVHIADANITTAKLAAGAVTTAKITDANITTAKLASNAVTTAKITNANITLAKMAANSVDSDQYVDGSIDTAHIADDQVTYAKIQNVSASDRILGRDSAGAGVIEEITPANLKTMLGTIDTVTVSNDFNGDNRTAPVVAVTLQASISGTTLSLTLTRTMSASGGDGDGE